MKKVTLAVFVLFAMLAPAASAQERDVAIDFSTVSEETVPRDAFITDEVVFGSDLRLGSVEGDRAARVGASLSGTFTSPVTALSLRVAPELRVFEASAIGEITLVARDEQNADVASKTVTVTSDFAAGTGFEYVTIDLGVLPRPARSFVLTGGGLEVHAPLYNCSSPTPTCLYFVAVSEVRYTVDSSGPDVAAPVITVPPDVLSLNATVPGGRPAAYPVRVSDNRDPDPDLSCSPPPGALLPIGTTIVDCTARDASGNESTSSFSVEVRMVGPRPPDPTKDYVVGFGSISGAQTFDVFVEADPEGSNAAGTGSGSGLYNFDARAVCLSVVGNRASVGFELTRGFESLGRGLLITYADNGDETTPDSIVSFTFMPNPPASCPEPSTGAASYTVQGDVDVHDAPPLPTTKDQCKNGGWKNFGSAFRNQGECVSFVATHPH
jgi:HYR domain